MPELRVDAHLASNLAAAALEAGGVKLLASFAAACALFRTASAPLLLEMRRQQRVFRVDGGRCGGEFCVGRVPEHFASRYFGEDSDDIVEAVQRGELCDSDGEELEWYEVDDLEHGNAPYSDGGFVVYEVTGLDERDALTYDARGDALHVKGECVSTRDTGDLDDPPSFAEDEKFHVPVMAFHSFEKGNFGSWLVKTDEGGFQPDKLAYHSVDTPVGRFVEHVLYDGVLLECEWDYCESIGKGSVADVGWLDLRTRDASHANR